MSTQALSSIEELSDKTKELFLSALQQGVVPATGCTEPISIAYAAAVCMSYLESEQPSKHKAGCGAADKIESLSIKVSPNIMNNALAVIVPGTSEPGLVIAAAAGALVGLAQEGLGVISKLEACELAQIKEFASSGKITAELAAVEDDLYVEAVLIDKQGNKVECYIASEHTHIFKLVRNGCSLIEKERPAPHAISPIKQALQDCSFKEVWNFAHQIELEKISFINTAADLNMELAKIGLEQNFGLGLGRSIRQANDINFGGGMDADLCTKLIAYTSAASDARMGGALLPAMSNSGSGNQGITATVPGCVLAQEL